MLLVSGQERRIIVVVIVALFVSDGGQLITQSWKLHILVLFSHVNCVAINLCGILLGTKSLGT